jgi:23S rRNA (cytidine1920-2'-O)/16S rRNA (cytidine1409-2'-O)-methyltransferase
LVKPQFEAGAAALDHQGVVRDPKDHDRAVAAVRAVVDEVEEWAVREVVASPILGGEGNQEFLLLAQRRKNPSGLQAGCG